MNLHTMDLAIIVVYLVITVAGGIWISKLASRNMGEYFLAGNNLPWYVLGISNSSSMFDITGTMWLVYLLFAYGLKSVWIPWIWPTFNQIFAMVFLSIWLRRSNVLTGAEWMATRFGSGFGSRLSHLSVVFFALVSVVGFIGYDFQGIGKFASVFLPWDFTPNAYAVILMGLTTVYIITGGMYSVVLTDVMKYVIMVITSFVIGFLAMSKTTPEQVGAAVPDGWHSLWFGLHHDLDWSGLIGNLNDKMAGDEFGLFGIFFMMILFKGILASLAGPAPNYDMQRVLSSKTPREAALMSWFVSITQFVPRYMLITGITVLALVYFSPQINAMGPNADFEQILPYIVNNLLPVGIVGLMLAGLLAAFMSTFDATVNAGTAYVVVDIYKKYLKRTASEKHYVYASYLCTVLVVVIGICFGLMAGSIGSVTMWLVAGLYGGYLAPNVLKWYWWRLNGFGYFAGMISGVLTALLLPLLFPDLSSINSFPIILLISSAASVLTSLLTKPEDPEVLNRFYMTVRPWGFWKPVREEVCRSYPAFKPNLNFKRDMINIAIGIVWQITLTLIPIYLVLRDYRFLFFSIGVTIITSIFLKYNWYDKLDAEDVRFDSSAAKAESKTLEAQAV